MEAMTERRTVTMYPQHWAVVDAIATQMALRDGGNPDRYASQALRHIVTAFSSILSPARKEPANEPAA